MTELVGYAVRDGIAYLEIDNPPVNALSRDVRLALLDLLDTAEEDDTVDVIVLLGAGASFPSGADLRELEKPFEPPSPAELCERVALSDKPVVAALHGNVLGAGFELALAAHYRVALAGTRVGMPEIKLGLMPSAGGTQLLPRFVGAGTALDMLLSGQAFPVDRMPGRAFVDAVGDGALMDAADRYCAKLVADGAGPRRSADRRDGLSDAAAFQGAIADRLAQVDALPDVAPREIVKAVEAAALLPFEAGIAFEEAAFQTCQSHPQAAALSHILHAERRAAAVPLPQGQALPELTRVGVLGGGPLAAQCVVACLQSGLGVNWGIRDPERLREGVEQVTAALQQGVAGAADPGTMLGRLRSGSSEDMVGGADLLIHAARGQGDVPAPHDLVRIVAMASRVDGIGLRFAAPVQTGRLAEIVQGPDCTAPQLAAALALVRKLGKQPVLVRSTGDSVAGRLIAAAHRAADALVDAGASPFAVDRALKEWGWPRPLFQSRDVVGLSELAPAPRAEGARNWSQVLVAAGRAGRAGTPPQGFYDWSGGIARADPALDHLIDEMRPRRDWAAGDIARLVIGAMANEGARMVASGMVRSAADVDVVSVHALDIRRLRGGVMKAVSQDGIFATATAMRRLDHPDRGFWEPAAIWADLAKNGQTFDDLVAPRRAA
ncbi:enoyl-CoA hydratase/isomerase family protein [Thalassococcus sp. CAU 1522]|uniref:Enoyl-CoA hydratase/isomerase family protein n=1 Tax=Thalassococcus arenae TaxID=2851652 RepID=A0ABS6ND49_9RHOB|nr:enoyl-CoA hydratase/isomerase family protein [Thalassococcus arenae]MBV2361723.1 enoyl-CoA hydratase/isomerase family protein [Thalassococcus arenae]